MTSKRKRYPAKFKAKVALEALRGEVTAAQLATKHGIHQTTVGEWRRQAMEGLTAMFANRSGDGDAVRGGGGKAAWEDRPVAGETGLLAEASGR